MDKILAVTDLHVTEAGGTIIGLDPAARLAAVLAHASRNHPDAAAMVLLGDLAHHGRPGEYARLAEHLARLPWPVIPMPGNHDDRAALVAGLPSVPLTGDGFVQTVLDLPSARIVTLDSNANGEAGVPHHAGRLCADRLAWLDAALAGAAGRQVLVFVHHPPVAVGLPGMDPIRLLNGEALLARLSVHGRAHLFCGHVHRTASGSAAGVSWTMFKSPCHQAPLDFTTADSGLSIDEPGAYGVILATPEGVIAHCEDLLASRPAVGRDTL